MAKKRASKTLTPQMLAEDAGTGDAHSDRRDALQEAMSKQMLQLFGSNRILSHEETLARLGGLAFPALCLRYIWHQDAFPLGRIYTLGGLYRSCKTAMAVEMARWVITYQGLGWYMDVEHKESPLLREAIMQHDPKLWRYLEVMKCDSQEMWQSGVTNSLTKVKGADKDAPWLTPGIGIVDSVAAGKPDAEVVKFLGERGGAGHRGYASIALLNGDWIGHVSHHVSNSPYVCALVQHSSETPVVGGRPGAVKLEHKGGTEVGYAKTVSFEMRRIRDLPETANGSGGMDIRMGIQKNSIGPSNRQIIARVRWWWAPDPKTGKSRQNFLWDWHATTIQLLTSFGVTDGKKMLFKQICEVCDLHTVTKQRVWSKALGIPKDSPLSFSEAGEVLEYDFPQLMPRLYELLNIERRAIPAVGGDFRDLYSCKVPVLEVPAPAPYPRGLHLGVELQDDDAT